MQKFCLFLLMGLSCTLAACGTFGLLNSPDEYEVNLEDLVVTEQPTRTPIPTMTPFLTVVIEEKNDQETQE